MQLSKDFGLEEFTVSQIAAREGFNNSPRPAEASNLKRLCETILQPLRDSLGKGIRVSSGYRTYALNSLVGGSKTSAHIEGRAADITVSGLTPTQLAEKIIELRLPFEQCIQEFDRWCHVSVPKVGEAPKREVLTATNKFGKTSYKLGLDKN